MTAGPSSGRKGAEARTRSRAVYYYYCSLLLFYFIFFVVPNLPEMCSGKHVRAFESNRSTFPPHDGRALHLEPPECSANDESLSSM